MKRKLLIALTILSMIGLAACESKPDTNTDSNKESNNIIEQKHSNNIEDATSSNTTGIAKYTDCTDLRMPSEMKDLNLIGKIAFISYDGMVLTTDNELRKGYGTYDNAMFKTKSDFKDFYLTYDLDILSQNTDGSYSYYPYYGQGKEIRFNINNGKIIETGKLTSGNIYVLVQVENNLIAHIIDSTTGKITDTIDTFNVKDSSGHTISAEFKQLLHRPGTHIVYVTDTDNNLRGHSSNVDLSIWSDDDKSVDLYMPSVSASNVDQLLGSDDLCNVVYSKIADSNHIYINNLNYSTFEYEEETYNLPDGYTTSDINEIVFSSATNSIIIFNDKTIYYLNRNTNETKKLEALSALNQEGHILNFFADTFTASVLMDDNTIYQIRTLY